MARLSTHRTSMGNPKASIIIATYNRADLLELCLEAISRLEADPAQFEIILVDNNSTDDTSAVVQAFSGRNPQLKLTYLCEPEQGATRARNKGIASATGGIICFLDDDAVPASSWLAETLAGFADPEVGCVGGPAILDFMGRDVPAWLAGDLKGLLSGYGLGYQEPTVITEVKEFPFLCNMAIRREVLDKVGLFDLELGPSGSKLVVGEETELMKRIRAAGWTILYLPAATVNHLVTPERLRKSYIYRSGRRLAVTHIYVTWDRRPHKILRWLASDAWYATRRFFWLLLALLRRHPLWFDDYMRFWMVGLRIPLRVRALLEGKESIAKPTSS